MFSVFGIILLVVMILSSLALLLHYRVMKSRGKVDESFQLLDTFLRDRFDLIMKLSRDTSSEEKIMQYWKDNLVASTQQLIKVMPKLNKAITPLLDDPEKSEILIEDFQDLEFVVKMYNEHVQIYNDIVSQFPWSAIAFISGLKVESKIKVD